MKRIIKQFQNATEHVVLEVEDKALMRERLVQYMEYKPLRTVERVERAKRVPAVFPLLSFFRAKHLSGALIIALVTTSGTFGISFAATEALPGDFLYPVKVNINEEVKAVFIRDEEGRADWNRERAELRLTEASQLAAEGRLDTDKQETVTQLFAVHTEAIVTTVRAVETSDPVLAAELSDDFEQALGTHEAVLARLIVEQEDGTVEGARGLVEMVKEAALEAGKTREKAEEMIGEDSTDDAIVVEEATESDDMQEIGNVPSDATQINDETNATRVRAAQRAEERAVAHLADAEEALSSLDSATDVASTVRDRIALGKIHMEEAANARAQGSLKKAYREFREAGAMFQQVAQIVRASSRFEVALALPEPAPTVEPEASSDTPEEHEALDEEVSTEEVSLEESPAPVEESLDVLRERASTTLTEAQALLAAMAAYDAATLEHAGMLVMDASASLLRADVARGLGDEEGARSLYALAQTQAEQAREALLAIQNADDGEESDTEAGEQTDTTQDSLFTLYHRYENGEHIFTGSYPVDTSCRTLAGEVSVAESMPEQLTLTLVIIEPVDASAECTETVPVEQTFEVRATASSEATTTRVIIDGLEPAFTVVEGTYGVDTAQDTGVPVSQLDEQPATKSILKRAFYSTQELLGA